MPNERIMKVLTNRKKRGKKNEKTCSLCGVEGIVQQRGNSMRIQHYQGFINGKRKYTYRKLEVKWK